MKVLLDIQDKKADFVMELLSSFSFIKTEKISPAKINFLRELRDSVEEINQAQKGKLKLTSAKEFLNEL